MKSNPKKLQARFNKIIRQCYRDVKGGLLNGLDYPTLAVLWPDRYAELKELSRLLGGAK